MNGYNKFQQQRGKISKAFRTFEKMFRDKDFAESEAGQLLIDIIKEHGDLYWHFLASIVEKGNEIESGMVRQIETFFSDTRQEK